MDKPKNIGTDEALNKIKHYCAYQERNHQETRDKLYSYGLYKEEVETLLSQLIEEDYLNEERYAMAFASGRFRLKQWGKIKIRNELQKDKVSAYCIKKALGEIHDDDYRQTLEKLASKKLTTLKSEQNIFVKKTKLRNFLMQKGYESSSISEILDGI